MHDVDQQPDLKTSSAPRPSANRVFHSFLRPPQQICIAVAGSDADG
jgi:hypothetical protein